MTISIPLGKGFCALVDDADYPLVASHTWGVVTQNHTSYARTHIQENGQRKRILMHGLIQPTSAGMVVDHRNGNGLDNRRSNLRTSTPTQNCANRRRRRDSQWPYKGIQRTNGRGNWQARIKVDGKRYNLGSFATPEDAANAYDAAARRYFGEFARTNFQP